MTRLDALLAVAAGGEVPLPLPEVASVPVAGEGPLDAALAAVGESLGVEEVGQRRPFVGRSGQKLRQHARLAGVNLARARIDNVYPYYPDGGSITNVAEADLLRWQEDCRRRLRDLPGLRLIVACGNLALATFTGLRDITRRRGSVYTWEGKKVLAMIHPAMVLRRPEYEKHCRLDWERARVLLTPHDTHGWYCGCATRRERRHLTPATCDSDTLRNIIERYIERSQNPQEIVAIDLETPRVQGERRVVCISFAFSPEESLVVPWGDALWQWYIVQLCNTPCIKTGHNIVSFDRWWLQRAGVELRGEIRDTLALHHCLDPASAHSLEFCVSRYLWEPWYKDENKGHDFRVIQEDMGGYYSYCGLDACCARELYDLFWAQIQARQLEAFYRRHYGALFDPILDLSTRGVRVDHAVRRQLLTEWLTEARGARDLLGALNGSPMFTLGTQRDQRVRGALEQGTPLGDLPYTADEVQRSLTTIEKKTVSGVMLKDLLYTRLGLPVQLKKRSTGDVTPTSDAATLRKLKADYPDDTTVQAVVDAALTHNTAQKLASFCYDTHFDDDGRFRFTLKVNTEAARLASSAAPNGRGQNSQNAPRDKRYRAIFLPEVGEVLLTCDLSQVESRICFVRTGDPELIRLARLRSSQFDQHIFVASFVFHKSTEDVTPDERPVGKFTSHAAQRDMQAATMVETLLKTGIQRTEAQCQTYLEAYHDAFPGVRVWQAAMRKELRAHRRLVNRWGRVWDVRYEEMNAELGRRGCSWMLQSEDADLMNQCGFIPLWHWLRFTCRTSTILLHEHDELVCSCPVDEVYDVAHFMRDHLEVPLLYDGVELRVPVEFGMGANYGEQTKWKELPSRDVLEGTAQSLLERK